MAKEILGIRHILGLKVKELRTSKGLSYQELSEKTGLSISYLSEIEKGKKYPKGDKIMSLATALDVNYDYLVSLKVSKRIAPLVDLVNSDFFREFPLDLFGLEAQKIIEILSVAPEKLNAFIRSIQQIARNYEMNNGQFYLAAIRSFQELNNNYFQEIEEQVHQFRDAFGLDSYKIVQKDLVGILEAYFETKVDFDSLEEVEVLKHVRSYYNEQQSVLRINKGLSGAQVNFLLGRELGFFYMGMKNRPYETPPQTHYSFETLLNNFNASYFSAALMIDENEMVKDMEQLGGLEAWDSQFPLRLLEKYEATPEMLMQRMTNILPKHFNIKKLFFLRFVGRPDKDYYTLAKELHLNKQHHPHSNLLNEHYCRRWLALKVMKKVQESVEKGEKGVISGAQISKYWQTDDEYLINTLAFPNASKQEYTISITIGFLIDKDLKSRVNFLNDSSIPVEEVHTTCERCDVQNCLERKSPPYVYNQEQQQLKIAEALKTM